MTWFKVDDSFADHPKVLTLQAMAGWQGALALWTLAGSWASKHLTDGVIGQAVVSRLGGTEKDAELLVDCGLWERSGDGYKFHDWTSRNPLRTAVEAKREQTRERVAAWRNSKACNAVSNAVTHKVSNAVGNARPGNARPDPTRPDPIHGSPLRVEPFPGARVCEDALTVEQPPPVAELEPGEPDPQTPAETEPFDSYVRKAFAARYEARTATPPIWSTDNRSKLQTLSEWLLATQGADPRAACDRLLDAFFADPWVQDNGYPLGNLVNRAPRYLTGRKGSAAKSLAEQAHQALKDGRLDDFKALSKRRRDLRAG